MTGNLRSIHRLAGLEAVTDDPQAIASRALKEAAAAIRKKDALGLRQAAEKGWLAASAAADVAADRMGMREPGGAEGRRTVLETLETRGKLRRGALLGPFETARTFLHGECFHSAVCSKRAVLRVLEDVKAMTDDSTSALAKLSHRSRCASWRPCVR